MVYQHPRLILAFVPYIRNTDRIYSKLGRTEIRIQYHFVARLSIYMTSRLRGKIRECMRFS